MKENLELSNQSKIAMQRNEEEEKKNIENLLTLTPAERLNYWIMKYYTTKKEFSKTVGIGEETISRYCSGKARKISPSNLMLMQQKAGVNITFIAEGTQPELTDGITISPQKKIITLPSNSPIIMNPNIDDKIKTKKSVRGECTFSKVERTGMNIHIVDGIVANIVDMVIDGLESPKILIFHDIEFCNNYKLKIGCEIVIDEGKYEDGDVVIAKSKRACFIADYSEGKLYNKDIDKTVIDNEGVEVLGRVFKKIEGF